MAYWVIRKSSAPWPPGTWFEEYASGSFTFVQEIRLHTRNGRSFVGERKNILFPLRAVEPYAIRIMAPQDREVDVSPEEQEWVESVLKEGI